jgi:hypothetical protein
MRDAEAVPETMSWEECLPSCPDEVGAFFVRRGRILGLEVLGDPAAWSDMRDRILSSWIDRIEIPRRGRFPSGAELPRVLRETGQIFLDRCLSLPFEADLIPGRGIRCRFEGMGLRGASLVWESRFYHALFLAERKPKSHP